MDYTGFGGGFDEDAEYEHPLSSLEQNDETTFHQKQDLEKPTRRARRPIRRRRAFSQFFFGKIAPYLRQNLSNRPAYHLPRASPPPVHRPVLFPGMGGV